MYNFSNFLDKVLYMFQTGPLSIISSITTLYTQQWVFVMLSLVCSSPLCFLDALGSSVGGSQYTAVFYM